MNPRIGHFTSGVLASDAGLGPRLGSRSHRGSRMGPGFRRPGDVSASLGTGLNGLPPGFPCMDPRLHGRLTGLDDGLALLFRQRPAVVDPA